MRSQVREYYEQLGRLDRFEKLEEFLPGESRTTSYQDAANVLGMSEGALRVELHRMKQTYRRLLRADIAHTVVTVAEIEDELKHLIAVLQA